MLNAGYTAVPFEHVSNRATTTDHTCQGNKTTAVGVSLKTGADAKISFRIKRSINGTVVIPITDIALLYANISSTTTRGEAIAKVRISGSLTAPQSCQINAGQVIYFDFDTIPASEFSSTAGQAITSRKITKTVSIECTGMGYERTQKVDASLRGRTEAVTIRWWRQTMLMSGSKFTINRMLKLASTTASYPQTWATRPFWS